MGSKNSILTRDLREKKIGKKIKIRVNKKISE